MNVSSDKNKIITLAVIGIFLIALYVHVFQGLMDDWINNPDYSHGFFIPAIALYMVWIKRAELGQVEDSPSIWGLPLLMAGLGQFIVGHIGAEHFLKSTSLILVMIGITLLLWGKKTLRIVLIPILFLIFMIPLPAIILNEYAFTLKLFATKMAVIFIQYLGIAVLRKGNVLYLPSSTLEVVDACSGVRSLISLLALSILIGFVAVSEIWKKWLLIFSAIPIAIVSNVIRLILTAVFEEKYGIRMTEGLNHTLSGIFVFLIGLVLFYALFWIISHIHKKNENSNAIIHQ